MASYADNFTPRLKVKYMAAGITHTIMVRGIRGTSAVLMANKLAIIHDLFNNFAAQLADDFTFLQGDIALTDSDDWIPTSIPVQVVGTQAVAQFTPWQKITSTTHSGRSAGSRARYSMYGIKWDLANQGSDIDQIAYNGVVDSAEHAGVAANKILADAQLASNAGVAATFYTRMTVKPNDALLRKLRNGTIS